MASQWHVVTCLPGWHCQFFMSWFTLFMLVLTPSSTAHLHVHMLTCTPSAARPVCLPLTPSTSTPSTAGLHASQGAAAAAPAQHRVQGGEAAGGAGDARVTRRQRAGQGALRGAVHRPRGVWRDVHCLNTVCCCISHAIGVVMQGHGEVRF